MRVWAGGLAGLTAAALALALATTALPSAAQQAAPGGGYVAPRTSWGAPDMQGVWTNSSITRLTRPRSVETLTLTPEAAAALEARDFNNIRTAAELQPTDPNAGAPERGRPLPPVGNYNAVWVDPGSKIARVRGELRSSWIVEPADGQIPWTEAGRKALERLRPGDAGYDGPESRGLGERCLIGFGGSGGPVMLNVLYNNHYQIVQTPDHVMILVEMAHDARIVPIGGAHRPAALAPWLGDSVGRWEGDTLVVTTRNVHPQQKGPVHLSAGGVLTERFTRVGEGELLYEFAVDDPAVYASAWRGEMAFARSDDAIYEYACHEGNYGLENILMGAREQEKLGKALAITADSE
jgi:hypothetical protein